MTKKHTVITYFEARRNASDWAHMDILLYRSENGGDTFSAPIVMANGTDMHPTVNNPVCIVDDDNTLHFLYCIDYSVGGGDVLYRRSDDDGITWSAPRSILEATKPELHNVFACGPGHGIRMQNGTLLVPIWMVKKEANVPLMEHSPSSVFTLYSKDHGDTWHLGAEIPMSAECRDPSETQAALCADGSVYLNIRTACTGYRAYTVGKTGYDGWKCAVLDRTLPDPTCFGSTAAAVVDGQHMLAVVNCANQTERKNLVLRISLDDGATWKQSFTVEPGDAGYADIAFTDDGTIYVLYEQRYGERERLAVIHVKELF
ncbi:MAG: exo-alpha-sialidase [Clostridia bacterium]|nr:exo-alpha-sialidase [Clostridia bacterium]